MYFPHAYWSGPLTYDPKILFGMKFTGLNPQYGNTCVPIGTINILGSGFEQAFNTLPGAFFRFVNSSNGNVVAQFDFPVYVSDTMLQISSTDYWPLLAYTPTFPTIYGFQLLLQFSQDGVNWLNTGLSFRLLSLQYDAPVAYYISPNQFISGDAGSLTFYVYGRGFTCRGTSNILLVQLGGHSVGYNIVSDSLFTINGSSIGFFFPGTYCLSINGVLQGGALGLGCCINVTP